ncbi:hypothetical protein DL770_004843 [Monosporascus sp. CRB-9-2]|nr:hypothetical protein DL770_004843 [Monosporascus sp. CRB-9-2]
MDQFLHDVGVKEYYPVCDNCRIKKIRCGREKPACSNCTRLGQRCDWSGQGKRSNQTALLSRNVAGLDDRLQRLEVLAVPPTLAAPQFPLASPSRPGLPHAGVTTKPVLSRPQGRVLTDGGKGISGRYFGPTSLEFVALDIKKLISERYETVTKRERECALRAKRSLDALIDRGEERFVDLTGYITPPIAPPFVILDAMIEPYFSTINPYFPIWTRAKFSRMLTSLRQSPHSERDRAAIICCNNLILLTMSTNSLRLRQRLPRSAEARQQTHEGPSMDSDVTAGLIENVKRAIGSIDALLSPRLIDIQAMLSLCVIAQERLSSDRFEALFVLAAHFAKVFGVHQWKSLRGQLDDEDVEERRNVSYCFYVLDKAVCWTSGTSPTIRFSEVSLGSEDFSFGEGIAADYLYAKVELAALEEAIHLELYTPNASAGIDDQVLNQLASRTRQKFVEWLTDSTGTSSAALESGLEIPDSKVELAIGFSCAQLLLIWPAKDNSDSMSEQRKELAKKCMYLILRLCSSTADEGRQIPIPR